MSGCSVADATRPTVCRSVYRGTRAFCCTDQHHCVSPTHMFYSRDTNCSRMADGDLAKRIR